MSIAGRARRRGKPFAPFVHDDGGELHLAGQAHGLHGSCSGGNEHFGASGECRASRDNIIDQRYGETGDREVRLYGERSGNIRHSLFRTQVNLSVGPAGPNQRIPDVQAQQASCLLGEEERLIETTLTKSSWVKRHRNERVNSLQLGDCACQMHSQVRCSRPLPVVLVLNDSAAQPAVERSDRSDLFQIFGCRMALAAQVGTRHTTSGTPRCSEEWQRRTTVVTKPRTAPFAASTALRIDEINGEFSSVSEGVDDAPKCRVVATTIQV